MKLTKLLVLGALLLVGRSAWAVDANVWTKPASASMEMDVEYYFYNVGSKMFFTQGNAWGTQASVGEEGLRVKIAETSAGVYTLTDYVKTQSAWKMWWFVDNATDPTMYVDYNNQANYLWNITDIGGNVYRLSPSKENPFFADYTEVMYVGLNRTEEGQAERTYLTWNNTADGGAFIDWEFYPADAYDIYAVAMQLKDVLNRAEELGLTLADQTAVYNNTASTLEELQEAKKTASEAVEAREKEIIDSDIIHATGAAPKDASIWITNGTFDTIGDFKGWSGTSFGAGGTTSTNAEHYNKTYDTYQDITVKYPGLYLFGVKGFYRAGSSDKSYKLYKENDPEAKLARFYVTADGKTSELQISSIWEGAQKEKPSHGKAMSSNGMWIPNTMADANEFFHADGLYSHLLPVEIEGSDVSARIGVKKDKTIDNNDWSIFDDFTLLYLGSGDDRYVGYSKILAASYPVYEGVIATQSYLDAYNTLRNNPAGTDKASAEAYIASLNTAKENLVENISLWSNWEDLVSTAVEAIEKYSELDDDAIVDLMMYADETEPETDVKTIRAARSLDNDALKAEIEKLTALIDAVESAAKNQIQEGDDVTKFLVNPKFDDAAGAETGWTGWHTVGNSMPTTGGTDDNKTAEAWNSNGFDLYQEVEKAPVGVYEISVQGFYRYGRGDDAWRYYQSKEVDEVKEKGAPVYVYMNDIKTPFKNVYDEEGKTQDFYVTMAEANADGTPQTNEDGVYIWKSGTYNVQTIPDTDPIIYFPNGMASAAVAFSAGLYTQTASSLIAKKGDKLRIGVKGNTSQLGDSWVIWDNFKLTYKGFNVEVVKPVLEDAIKSAKSRVSETFASDLKAKLAAALAEAEAALSETDGKAMFDKLAALTSIDVDGSIQKYKDFEKAVTDFETAVANASEAEEEERPLESTLAEASKVLNTVQNYLDGEFTDAQLDEALEQMKELTKKLKVPASMDTASDAAPANATYLINNPTFDSSDSGWTFTGDAGNKRQAEGVYEIWRTKVDCTFSQELSDMPEGTYEISVQGIYRYSWADNDYKTFTEDASANNNASVYVKVGETETTSILPRLAKLAQPYTAEVTLNDQEEKVFNPQDHYQWAEKTVDADSTVATGYIMPDMLDVLNPFFESGDVASTGIIFKVGAEGKATIGIRVKFDIDGDWSVWDNWKLTYYGKDSAKEVGPTNGIKDASTMGEVVKTEVFNLSGVRVKNGKGIAIVRQTLSNGTVRVKKVMVK